MKTTVASNITYVLAEAQSMTCSVCRRSTEDCAGYISEITKTPIAPSTSCCVAVGMLLFSALVMQAPDVHTRLQGEATFELAVKNVFCLRLQFLSLQRKRMEFTLSFTELFLKSFRLLAVRNFIFLGIDPSCARHLLGSSSWREASQPMDAVFVGRKCNELRHI
mmetsp:Transcript_7402/g.16186  ORF Transcript_7402/g.16186 Transcript_7402/m.16186 type:complete len:164 (-) Transcript_7402:603-1094(-)